MSKAFGAPEQAKIKQIVAEGVTVMQEIQDLTEGLNETIKAVAEELEVKPGVIKKAIRIAQKDQWDQVCLLYTSPSPRDGLLSRMPSSA